VANPPARRIAPAAPPQRRRQRGEGRSATAPGGDDDFDALYGGAGNTGNAAAYDPWEPFNRKVHTFNNAVDRGVARPLATAYTHVVPRFARTGVSNFFSNLRAPVTITNQLLQGRGADAWDSLGRFLMNSTLGIGGLFDPASKAMVPRRNEDFGQTLGAWGWRRSRYVELPFFGPRTVRDVFGLAGDIPLSPIRRIEEDKIRIGLQGLQLVDTRAQLLAIDDCATPPWTSTRWCAMRGCSAATTRSRTICAASATAATTMPIRRSRSMRCRCRSGPTESCQRRMKNPASAGFSLAVGANPWLGRPGSGRQRGLDGLAQARVVGGHVRGEAGDDLAVAADQELLEVPQHRRRRWIGISLLARRSRSGPSPIDCGCAAVSCWYSGWVSSPATLILENIGKLTS
jgi:ABC-type transporter lipoprotein component MlaA